MRRFNITNTIQSSEQHYLRSYAPYNWIPLRNLFSKKNFFLKKKLNLILMLLMDRNFLGATKSYTHTLSFALSVYRTLTHFVHFNTLRLRATVGMDKTECISKKKKILLTKRTSSAFSLLIGRIPFRKMYDASYMDSQQCACAKQYAFFIYICIFTLENKLIPYPRALC